MKPFAAVLATMAFLSSQHGFAASTATEMQQAAETFLKGLSPEQRERAVMDFKTDERLNWDFVPKSRTGIPFKDLDPTQQESARALLRSGLSHEGYAKATNIISVIEQVLRDLERSSRRDPGLYYVSLFGSPTNSPWGWRVEGHHLSLNFTVNRDQVFAFSPSFMGSNPAEVRQGPHQGYRTFAVEEDLGRELATSLDMEQRQRGIISTTAPRDIITGSTRKANRLEPMGIAHSELKPAQQQQLERLLREYVTRFKEAVAEAEWKRITNGGLDKVFFAWAGSLEKGRGHYYRIQGPHFLVEYDNTQNQANHVHTVWRDFENDFGLDLLRKHYDGGEHPH